MMRLIQQLGEPGLEKRLRDAGDVASDSITLSQFSQFLTRLGMLPPDILSVQRIVGFYTVERMKIADIMLKILERAGKRQQTEVQTLQGLAREFQQKEYTLAQAFQHLDTDGEGSVSAQELQNCLRAMKIEIGAKDLMNIIHLFDTNGDNQIQLDEFESQMAKYMGGSAQVHGRIKTLTKEDLASKIIPEEMQQQIVDTMNKEEKQKVELKSFKLATGTAGKDIKARENEIIQ
jgi:Ca2+-binding EF-hand superfamily protein